MKECVKAFSGFGVSKAGGTVVGVDEAGNEKRGQMAALLEKLPLPRVWLEYSEKLCILERE